MGLLIFSWPPNHDLEGFPKHSLGTQIGSTKRSAQDHEKGLAKKHTSAKGTREICHKPLVIKINSKKYFAQ